MKEKGVTTWAVIHCPRCGYGYDCRIDAFVSVPSLHLPEGYIKGTNGAGDDIVPEFFTARIRA